MGTTITKVFDTNLDYYKWRHAHKELRHIVLRVVGSPKLYVKVL